jgi:hypothetical protein
VKSKGHYAEGNCKTESFTENKKHVKKYTGHFEWVPGAQAACFAQKGGKYKNSECSEEDVKNGVGKGKYEKTGGGRLIGAGNHVHFAGDGYRCEEEGTPHVQLPREDCTEKHTTKPWNYYTPSGEEWSINCAQQEVSGEAAGVDEIVDVVDKLSGCLEEGLKIPVTTPGLPSGEVEFNQMKGHLGYINKAKHEVGVVLEPATAGGLFAELEWQRKEGERSFVRVGAGDSATGSFFEEPATPGFPNGDDAVVSAISPVGEASSTFIQNYLAEEREFPCVEAEGCYPVISHDDVVQIPDRLEGGRLQQFEAWKEGEEETVFGYEPGVKGEWRSLGEQTSIYYTVEGDAEIRG